SVTTGPTPQIRDLPVMGEKKLENVMSLSPDTSPRYSGCDTYGMTQRSIMFHFELILNGTTGWTLSTVRSPSSGPTPFSQLNWNGMLVTSETGFESFFASSCEPWPPASACWATAGDAAPRTSARTHAYHRKACRSRRTAAICPRT